MTRRSILAALLAGPLARFLPASTPPEDRVVEALGLKPIVATFPAPVLRAGQMRITVPEGADLSSIGLHIQAAIRTAPEFRRLREETDARPHAG